MFYTANFYKFVELHNLAQRKADLIRCCQRNQVKGLVILAREGINGSLGGEELNVAKVLDDLRQDPLLKDLQHKAAFCERQPFHRLRINLKDEIVTMGLPDVHPAQMAGTYVKPEDWNRLLQDPDLVLIDTRNDYEVELGTFAGAINPNIKTFAQLPQWLDESQALKSSTGKQPKVAMFCTGGIRCEKSTAYLRSRGFKEVYHLEGGILKYLETVKPETSLWQGECFVFDERVSVGHGLAGSSRELCRACRIPLEDGAAQSPLFEPGVSCPRCHALTTEEKKNSARERQRQWELSKARQRSHIGSKAP